MHRTLRVFCVSLVAVLAFAGCRSAGVFDADQSGVQNSTVVLQSGNQTVPFDAHGETTFEVVPPFPPPTVHLIIGGEGNSSPFGHFTFSATSEIDAVTGEGTNMNINTYSNGDELHWSSGGVAVEDPPGTAVVIGEFTITGGTGRFKNASGGGTVVVTADLAAGTSFFDADGVISGFGGPGTGGKRDLSN